MGWIDPLEKRFRIQWGESTPPSKPFGDSYNEDKRPTEGLGEACDQAVFGAEELAMGLGTASAFDKRLAEHIR